MALATSTTTPTNQKSTNHRSGRQPGHATSGGADQQLSALVAPDHGRYVTKEEYWAVWYEAKPSYEWNNGYLEVKPMPNPIQLQLFHWFLELMRQYVAVAQNATLMSLETGFTMRVPDPDQPHALKEVVRKPDLAAILHTNPVTWGADERSYRGTCDLCIEAISDSSKEEILRDIKIKKSEYEFAGVQEYYILDPSGANLHFYEQAPTGGYVEMQPDPEGVIRSKVLPGFQFRHSDLKRQRSLETLALDDVYRGFVLLRYQAAEARAIAAEARATAERQRAAAERQRAAAERQRAAIAVQQATVERQRAEHYAAKLRALGIDLDPN